ncbi:MAG TPA: lytic transglycosylase domain-containing protein [Acidobacteriaceae bacterium]|nr:lytic transglycosylase domain-containing protein [Acidobacteriaceae bacterium]
MLPIARKWRTVAPYLALAITFTATCARGAGPAPTRVAEHITLRNGFDLICDHRVADGAKVRLYMDASGNNFLEVNATDIVAAEKVTLPAAAKPADPAPAAATAGAAARPANKLTDEDLRPLLTQAGTTYDIDPDLLASVVRQESGGQPRAVSRAGARGLMQLMPGTAANLGVADSFAPGENIRGGTGYLNQLLDRYHNNLVLALAAYNAGPAAVDRWHGIPPYSETRAYVARVIREYNRRYALRHRQASAAPPQVAALAH